MPKSTMWTQVRIILGGIEDLLLRGAQIAAHGQEQFKESLPRQVQASPDGHCENKQNILGMPQSVINELQERPIKDTPEPKAASDTTQSEKASKSRAVPHNLVIHSQDDGLRDQVRAASDIQASSPLGLEPSSPSTNADGCSDYATAVDSSSDTNTTSASDQKLSPIPASSLDVSHLKQECTSPNAGTTALDIPFQHAFGQPPQDTSELKATANQLSSTPNSRTTTVQGGKDLHSGQVEPSLTPQHQFPVKVVLKERVAPTNSSKLAQSKCTGSEQTLVSKNTTNGQDVQQQQQTLPCAAQNQNPPQGLSKKQKKALRRQQQQQTQTQTTKSPHGKECSEESKPPKLQQQQQLQQSPTPNKTSIEQPLAKKPTAQKQLSTTHQGTPPAPASANQEPGEGIKVLIEPPNHGCIYARLASDPSPTAFSAGGASRTDFGPHHLVLWTDASWSSSAGSATPPKPIGLGVVFRRSEEDRQGKGPQSYSDIW